MEKMRVTCLEAMGKLNSVNTRYLKGTDCVEDVRFQLYFDFLNRQIVVRGYPTRIVMRFEKRVLVLPVPNFHPEYCLLFKDIETKRLKSVYRDLGFVEFEAFGWDAVTPELEKNLPVERFEIYNMVSENGLTALCHLKVLLTWPELYSSEIVYGPDRSQTSRDT